MKPKTYTLTEIKILQCQAAIGRLNRIMQELGTQKKNLEQQIEELRKPHKIVAHALELSLKEGETKDERRKRSF